MKEISEEIKQYINGKIEEKLKKNLKKEIGLIILSVLLTAIVTFLVTFHFSERYVDITSAYEIKEDYVVIKLVNNALTHSTSVIKIYGKEDNNERLLIQSENKILKPQGGEIELKIPTRKVMSDEEILIDDSIAVPSNKTGDCEFVERFDTIGIETKNLWYRIECEGCRNRDDYKLIPQNTVMIIKRNEDDSGLRLCKGEYFYRKWA